MSYDLTIAAHRRPPREAIEAWAAGQGLEAVAGEDPDQVVLKRPGRDDAPVCEAWGPFPAEAEDFEEELAAACLAPRWMMEVSTGAYAPKAHIRLARSLARHLAEVGEGAAYDRQEGRLVWPRGRAARVPGGLRERNVSLLELAWFIAPSRWPAAAERLAPLLARRCPEALPRRYGEYEPLRHRLDPANPEAFSEFLAGADDFVFWHSTPPSFGGEATPPHADKHSREDDEPFRVGNIELSFDGDVVASDERWREAVASLLVAGAEAFGALFAAAQIEPGWIADRRNRLMMDDPALMQNEQFLYRMLWQGLPPVPVWLSWYGEPYRDLVRDALMGGLGPGTSVEERESGIAVRLAEVPRPRRELPPLPLPSELTYRAREPWLEDEDGSIVSNLPEPDDRARVIPDLECTRESKGLRRPDAT